MTNFPNLSAFSFPPTEEQAAILRHAETGKSLMVRALAGSAKSTTIKMIAANQQLGPDSLILAFNKKIAMELEAEVPCRTATINALGWREWKRAYGNTQLNARKMSDLRAEHFPDAPWEVARLASLGKLTGIVPKGNGVPPTIKGITPDDPEVWLTLCYMHDFDPEFIDMARELVQHSIVQAIRKKILDFDDQIFMPVITRMTFPKVKTLFVDEAQDLSPLNAALLDRIPHKQLIVVGDPLQSIYAFRGADVDSMTKLKVKFQLPELPLTICFRCPTEVVKVARQYAPDMRSPDWISKGSVATPNHDDIDAEWFHGKLILCRNNAPLVALALKLTRLFSVGFLNTAGKQQMFGALNQMCKGKTRLTSEQIIAKADTWVQSKIDDVPPQLIDATIDKAECIKLICEEPDVETFQHVRLKIAELFADPNASTKLGSGHSAKGLEAPEIVFLDRHLIPSRYAETPEQLQQEENLAYVITTRAQESLYYVNSDVLRNLGNL